jgi:hypothetical protein
MNSFARVLILTVQLWHPASLPVFHPSDGIFQRLTHSLTRTRQAEMRLQATLEEAVLFCA